MLDSQNLLTEVLFDPVSLSLVIKVIQLYQCFTFDDFLCYVGGLNKGIFLDRLSLCYPTLPLHAPHIFAGRNMKIFIVKLILILIFQLI